MASGYFASGCFSITKNSAELRSLAERLGRGSATTVGRLLKPLGYSLKTSVKRLVGKVHPKRDWQYRLIQRTKALFFRTGQPVISVDAKKSELIGDFKNRGKRYCQKADEVNVYDFPGQAKCKATPYGILLNIACLVRLAVTGRVILCELYRSCSIFSEVPLPQRV